MGVGKLPPSQLADPVLLNKIDKLFATGVGDYVSLPQLVVVGDQSSGKSSVLEGVTRLPFPRDSGLCTRFATQITFRRTRNQNVSISIIPDTNASEEHAAAVASWKKTDLRELDPKLFADVMREVHQVMGLANEQSDSRRSTFSRDILKIEVCGPEEEHFSVVDVPGIFRVRTEGVTTDADKEMVLSMVKHYMENPRSIILAVIPANVDIATQEILTLAEEADKDGHRTVGVLTKPDLVDVGAEGNVMDLINGHRHKLNLGWCIVRNLGQHQLQNSASVDRDQLEKDFFRERYPWNTLDEEKFGVASLRTRLQEILGAHIRREFPKVKSEILKKLAMKKKALTLLGKKRERTNEQQQFLVDMSMEFQKIADSALNANYASSDCFEGHDSLRFATAVISRNEQLASEVAKYGHLYSFAELETDKDISESESSVKPDDLSEGVEPGQEGDIHTRTEYKVDGLEEILVEDQCIPQFPEKDIDKWLMKIYDSSRGFELGTFDSFLLAQAMKTQSKHWEPIALGYVSDIICLAHMFIRDTLKFICPDKRVREEIMSILAEPLAARYREALECAKFILSVERSGTPATMNHYFNDNLQKSREARVRNAVQGKATTTPEIKGPVVRLADIVNTQTNMSNASHVVQSIHDILSAYYTVARKRFVDNLCMQAVDYYLVAGPDAPLRLFSPSFVYNLSEERLEEIAGEDVVVKRKRVMLTKEVKNLEASKKILG